jgi:hypothetical protein
MSSKKDDSQKSTVGPGAGQEQPKRSAKRTPGAPDRPRRKKKKWDPFEGEVSGENRYLRKA